jgi:uncharacterized repeat protein (TIGR02543 family)
MKKLMVLVVFCLLCLGACPDKPEWDEISIHIVTFDMCGGNIHGDTFEDTSGMRVWVYDSKSIEYLPIPEKDNYTFNGWFSRAGGLGDAFTNTMRIFSDRVVYAHWSN